MMGHKAFLWLKVIWGYFGKVKPFQNYFKDISFLKLLFGKMLIDFSWISQSKNILERKKTTEIFSDFLLLFFFHFEKLRFL